MKISLDWLREYVDFSFSPDELADKLTALGIEVEAIENLAKKFDKIVVGEVLEVTPHPNADKLRLTRVNIGNGEPLKIVCGAPNVAEGQKVAVATIGADLGDGFVIKKSKIRGEESWGMICSEKELGLSEDHTGIWVLPRELAVGAPLAKAIGKEDVVMEIGITPNRADCLSHIGIAREVIVAGGKNFRRAAIDKKYLDTSKTKTSEAVKITIGSPDNCPRYAARVVRGVKVKESPEWLKKRLEAIGLRPRNNIVDITNFVLMECGHPLHAFDLSKVKDNHIVVRTAEGFAKKFTTLDDKERELPPTALLISDPEKPLAIAGVMGGVNSEISDATTEVLIESAYFNPSSIRRTAKTLGLSTDASYRFERGTDIENVIYAVDRAATLMAELAGGEVLSGIVDEYPKKITSPVFSFRPSRARMLLGMDVKDAQAEKILASVGLAIKKNSADSWELTSPSHRVDLAIEADAIEEIARIEGYDNIPTSMFERATLDRERDAFSSRSFNTMLRQYLVGLGFTECLSTPMLETSEAKVFHPEPVEVMNPLTTELEVMRTSVMANLLQIARRNERYGAKGQRIFEIGNVFNYDKKPQLIANVSERTELSILIGGIQEEKSPYNTKDILADIFLLRSATEQVISRFGLQNIQATELDSDTAGKWVNISSYLEPGTAIVFSIGKEVIAIAGEIGSALRKSYDLHSIAFAAAIDYDVLYRLAKAEREKPRAMKPLPRYPAVERDIALILPQGVTARKLLDEVSSVLPKELAEDVRLFDEFQSKEMKAAGERSLGVRMVLRSAERTLEDEEVERITREVVSTIEMNLHARLRS
jgi:phenylalanyl-tRNA synthetase beta chain